MNSYRRDLQNGILVNPKFFILEKVNLGPHTNCWSNLVKRFKNLYYLVRVVTDMMFYGLNIYMKYLTLISLNHVNGNNS